MKDIRMKASTLLCSIATAGVLVTSTALLTGQGARATDTSADKPYHIVNGKVDMNTMKGYLYYGDQCMRCHGPDGMGSSYAPNLTQGLKALSQEQFENTVINGKKEVNQASDKVMPAFGTNEDIVENLDNIYDYLKARSDGALGRGHPDQQN